MYELHILRHVAEFDKPQIDGKFATIGACLRSIFLGDCNVDHAGYSSCPLVDTRAFIDGIPDESGMSSGATLLVFCITYPRPEEMKVLYSQWRDVVM